jgi:hypothetical protein
MVPREGSTNMATQIIKGVAVKSYTGWHQVPAGLVSGSKAKKMGYIISKDTPPSAGMWGMHGLYPLYDIATLSKK